MLKSWHCGLKMPGSSGQQIKTSHTQTIRHSLYHTKYYCTDIERKQRSVRYKFDLYNGSKIKYI